MKRSVGIWQLLGFAVTSLGGTLLHFLYDWLGKSAWIAPFSGVNESTWEHMKLLFWPMLLFAVVQRLTGDWRADFWCIKARGILLGISLIPILFYTYNGALGHSPDWINIAIFFVAAALAYGYETVLFRAERLICGRPAWAFAGLGLLALLFGVFTFFTPQIPLFQDPLTGTYGMP